jgi:two-component system chemotaxis sensor kinase CheA
VDDLLSDFLTETNESLADLDVALVTLEAPRTTPRRLDLSFGWFTPSRVLVGSWDFLGWNGSPMLAKMY